jgi:hypothetical protein
VTFGANPATNVVAVNATTVTCKPPTATAAGAVAVTVITAHGNASLASGFTYS